jgi:nicotinamide riboside transporter PnuC
MLSVELMATGLAVAGCVLNNRRRRACFGLWIVSNLICGVLHGGAGLWGLVVRDVLFSILAVEGFLKWREQS